MLGYVVCTDNGCGPIDMIDDPNECNLAKEVSVEVATPTHLTFPSYSFLTQSCSYVCSSLYLSPQSFSPLLSPLLSSPLTLSLSFLLSSSLSSVNRFLFCIMKVLIS